MGGDGGVSEEGRGRIATPDRRVRVFVSSTLEELAQERRAARAAISGLRLTPVMFELGARPHPPRELYRAYLAQSEVFVGIYWQRYGWVAPGESVSGLEDEYLLSGDRPKLIYVKAPAVDREPRLTELLHRVQADDRASYKVFTDAGELTGLLSDDLALLLTERFTARHPEAPPGLRPARLPVPPTAMIGRDSDREALVARLRGDARLVTVTGPGGVGKTRLALDVAAALANGTAEGVWFVDLAPVPEPARVPGAIAAELGVQTPGPRLGTDVLADRLAGRRVLLVLDNLEHLLPAAARDVARLLAMVSDLKVLATSRTVLRVRGEQEWPLRPLAVPEQDGDIRPQEAAVSPAVQLFLARAAEARPDFALTAENAAAVAEICRRLDGVPLAIELVAARTRVLPPAVLLERLGGRLDLGGDYADLPERQRTLRSTVDWSYRLLDAGERALLAWLSVFVGGWTVQAAEAVGAGTEPGRSHPDVMTTLSSLVDKSLVTVEDGGSAGPRFRMLGAVAEYAAERLDERGEREAAADRLVVFVGHLVEEAADGMRTAHRPWAARIDDELGNVRVAWRHTTPPRPSRDRVPDLHPTGLLLVVTQPPPRVGGVRRRTRRVAVRIPARRGSAWEAAVGAGRREPYGGAGRWCAADAGGGPAHRRSPRGPGAGGPGQRRPRLSRRRRRRTGGTPDAGEERQPASRQRRSRQHRLRPGDARSAGQEIR